MLTELNGHSGASEQRKGDLISLQSADRSPGVAGWHTGSLTKGMFDAVDSSSWYLKYCESSWLDWYRQEFTNKFANGLEDPEDACASVVEKLIVTVLPNAKLRHTNNLDAFVKTSFRNLASDYRRQLLGRLRAPVTLVKLGEPFPQIFFEYCVNRLRAGIIAEKIALPIEIVKDWVDWIKTHNKCPEPVSHLSISEKGTEDLMADAKVFSTDQSDLLTDEMQIERYSVIAHWLITNFTDAGKPSGASHNLQEKLKKLASPPLNADDRILLKLLYWEGLTLTDAAKALKQQRHTVRNHRNSLLKRLHTFFLEHNIEF